jgi:mannose-6-phosphate isomerase-like protein (cupin superfamily)
LAAARSLSWKPGRSAEVFVDGEMEIRFTGRPTKGMQVPHERDEFYIVASGTARYRVEDSVTDVGPGDLLFAAAHAPHGFEEYSDDFTIWIGFYGPVK